MTFKIFKKTTLDDAFRAKVRMSMVSKAMEAMEAPQQSIANSLQDVYEGTVTFNDVTIIFGLLILQYIY